MWGVHWYGGMPVWASEFMSQRIHTMLYIALVPREHYIVLAWNRTLIYNSPVFHSPVEKTMNHVPLTFNHRTLNYIKLTCVPTIFVQRTLWFAFHQVDRLSETTALAAAIGSDLRTCNENRRALDLPVQHSHSVYLLLTVKPSTLMRPPISLVWGGLWQRAPEFKPSFSRGYPRGSSQIPY